MGLRKEYDSLGMIEVPENLLYGAQTRRAELNFPISGWRLPENFILALVRLKKAAARVNCNLGKLEENKAKLIINAAEEVLSGKYEEHFPLDVFQTGSATSTNMNVNEVLANLAIKLAGGKVGSKEPVHPNDDVNMGQSSNDLTPSAAFIAAALELDSHLLPALENLRFALAAKAEEFADVVKIGRTHLQDAVPISLGQVFLGYHGQITEAVFALETALDRLLPLALGGTAVGTGINCHPEFAKNVINIISQETKLSFVESKNHFASQAAMDNYVYLASMLKNTALAMLKIANDIRFLASGPRCGLGEIRLIEKQPGSSIMPGKVNPVICEAVMQAVAFAVGSDAGVSFAAATLANFELAVAWPYSVWQVMETIKILGSVTNIFTNEVIISCQANEKRCQELCEQSLAMVTSLATVIGYDKAAEIAMEAEKQNKTIREVAKKIAGIEEKKLNEILNPKKMINCNEDN